MIHKLLEEISKGILPEQDINVKAEKLLVSKGVIKGQIGRLISMMEKDVSLLKEKGIWQDVIIPKQDSYSELPFVLGLEKTVYSGRIDRLIKDGGSLKIYDYKTFPVKDDDEMRYLLREYAFQMDIYKKAAGRLFSSADVRSYIIFTHMGEVREVK
ncbi:MAG: PD-(D/E)XK nuclease family protein [Nitrospirae bacterium]|nr:PD-(D/E)XK nuclease family protein [Nitrospirota bacterium]